MELTDQLKEWAGEFGKEYTDRNRFTAQDMERLYTQRFGVTRSKMNEEFLGALDRELRILEVGSNIGTQLILLKEMGFTNLYGLEIGDYALEIAKRREETRGISFIKGSALDIPFKDGFFDLVFTSGVLIHISPVDIKKAVSEIYRCSSGYVWGMEYYAEKYQEVSYRGHTALLWKTDFAGLYTENFPDLTVVKEKKYPYLNENGVEDQMFLLDKRGKDRT